MFSVLRNHPISYKNLRKVLQTYRKILSSFYTIRWTCHLEIAEISAITLKVLFIQWKKSHHSLTVYKTIYTFSQKGLCISKLQISTPAHYFWTRPDCFQMNFTVATRLNSLINRRARGVILSPPLCLLNLPGFLLYDILSVHNVLTALSQICVTSQPQWVKYYKLLQKRSWKQHSK